MGQITVELVEAIAETKDVEPTNLEYTLQEYIPLDAVEKLADHDNTTWTLSFELPEYTVTVTSERGVSVAEKETADKKTRVASTDCR